MKFAVTGAVMAAALFVASQAQALTFTNRDQVDQTITFMEGDKQEQLTLAPGQAGQRQCSGGCIIRLKNGDEYQFDGPEIVSIEGDIIFLDDVSQGSGGPGQDQNPPRNQ